MGNEGNGRGEEGPTKAPNNKTKTQMPASSSGRSKAMLEARNDRMRSEADVQLLANRLAHLRNEEAKARKKIEETRTRATEIVTLKRRNEVHLENRLTVQTMTSGAVSVEQEMVAKRREAQRRQVQATRAMVQKQKLDNVISQKTLKQRNIQLAKEHRLAEEERNRQRRAEILRQEAALRAKKERAKREQEQRVAEMYAKRMTEERERVEEADKLIREMEAEEEALIDRLRTTQAVQREAYEELQRTLAM